MVIWYVHITVWYVWTEKNLATLRLLAVSSPTVEILFAQNPLDQIVCMPLKSCFSKFSENHFKIKTWAIFVPAQVEVA
jgi:hypothetical protein